MYLNRCQLDKTTKGKRQQWKHISHRYIKSIGMQNLETLEQLSKKFKEENNAAPTIMNVPIAPIVPTKSHSPSHKAPIKITK